MRGNKLFRCFCVWKVKLPRGFLKDYFPRDKRVHRKILTKFIVLSFFFILRPKVTLEFEISKKNYLGNFRWCAGRHLHIEKLSKDPQKFWYRFRHTDSENIMCFQGFRNNKIFFNSKKLPILFENSRKMIGVL